MWVRWFPQIRLSTIFLGINSSELSTCNESNRHCDLWMWIQGSEEKGCCVHVVKLVKPHEPNLGFIILSYVNKNRFVTTLVSGKRKNIILLNFHSMFLMWCNKVNSVYLHCQI